MARTVLLALCLLGVANAQDHGHDHDSVEVCGCAAKEEDHPFSTDCKNKAALAASWKALSACEKSKKGCQESKDSKGMMVCKGAFFHLQFAHDWCPHDTLTEAQEKGIHDWEDYCVECAVSKPYNPKFKDCVKPKCEDASVAKKAFDTLKAKCTDPKKCCKDTEQTDAWTTVMSYHDLCDHDDVPEYIEKAFHDYEEACEDFGCNSVDKGYDGSKCPGEGCNALTAKFIIQAPKGSGTLLSAPSLVLALMSCLVLTVLRFIPITMIATACCCPITTMGSERTSV